MSSGDIEPVAQRTRGGGMKSRLKADPLLKRQLISVPNQTCFSEFAFFSALYALVARVKTPLVPQPKRSFSARNREPREVKE
jgi:hypothetical protein